MATTAPTTTFDESPAWTPYRSTGEQSVTVADGITWTVVDPGLNFDRLSLWPSRGRYLGIGSHSICPSFCVGEDDYLLSSPDAIDWTVMGQLPASPAGIFGVYQTDLGFFAVGQTDFWDGGKHAGIWHSGDGVQWTLSDEQAFRLGACGSKEVGLVDVLFETASGLLAFGTGAWRSTDGARWTCIDDAPAGGVQRIDAGFLGTRYEGKDVQLWTSEDGIAWVNAGAINGDFSVAPVSSGFVAVENGDARMGTFQSVFTSADGMNWDSDRHPFQPAYVYDLKSNGTQAVTVDQSDPAIWLSSADGADWTRHAVPTDAAGGAGKYEMEDVSLFGHMLMVTAVPAGGGPGPVLLMAQVP